MHYANYYSSSPALIYYEGVSPSLLQQCVSINFVFQAFSKGKSYLLCCSSCGSVADLFCQNQIYVGTFWLDAFMGQHILLILEQHYMFQKCNYNHIASSEPNPTHKLSLKKEGNDRRVADVEAPNLDLNGFPQIWMVDWNIVPVSTKMLIQEHVALGEIRFCLHSIYIDTMFYKHDWTTFLKV